MLGRPAAYKTCVGKAAAAITVLGTALLVTGAGSAATRGGATASAPPTTYTVAFASGSLPANVDQLVTAAGGTIVVRIPEIGGIGVVSSNPQFAATISASASVAAAEASVQTAVPPTELLQSPALGWLVVSHENPSGRDEAQQIPLR